jgi:hypothetical protein
MWIVLDCSLLSSVLFSQSLEFSQDRCISHIPHHTHLFSAVCWLFSSCQMLTEYPVTPHAKSRPIRPEVSREVICSGSCCIEKFHASFCATLSKISLWSWCKRWLKWFRDMDYTKKVCGCIEMRSVWRRLCWTRRVFDEVAGGLPFIGTAIKQSVCGASFLCRGSNIVLFVNQGIIQWIIFSARLCIYRRMGLLHFHRMCLSKTLSTSFLHNHVHGFTVCFLQGKVMRRKSQSGSVIEPRRRPNVDVLHLRCCCKRCLQADGCVVRELEYS